MAGDPREILDLAPPIPDFRLPYGADPRQFGELRVPKTGSKHPVCVALHGGFWRNGFNLAYMGHLCESLRAVGIATWNLEYRSVGDAGGGWPGTCQDVLSGVSYLRLIAETHHLDLGRLVALGHSAGGHLALWTAAKSNLQLSGVVGLGAVADLRQALDLNLGRGAVREFLNGADVDQADPVAFLPLRTKVRLLHGKSDDIVPPSIAERFVTVSKAAGDDAHLVLLEGGHFEPVDPRSNQWMQVQAEIARLL